MQDAGASLSERARPAPANGPRASAEVDAYLATHEAKTLLRFVICGSVDDGKSTLIGRLLYESQALYIDQLAGLEAESRAAGTQGEELDFALLLDGLASERAQGITIDVAYRHFATERRHFIVADAPGHEQYTRNMATGASTADSAVVLVDARKGLVTQTRRHSHIIALLGITKVALAINKMDLVDYSETRFLDIQRDYLAFAAGTRIDSVTCIPVCALRGDNVLYPSERMAFYAGPTLMSYLERVEVDQAVMLDAPLRFPVQCVIRPNLDFRGYAGTVSSGSVRPGDRIAVAPSGRESRVERIVTYDGDLDRAVAGQAVTLTLAEEVDISRGDVIAHSDEAPPIADRFEATIIWMSEQPMLRGREYLMRIGARTVAATVAPLKYKLAIDSLEHLVATRLEMNEIGVCELDLSESIPFDLYRENRDTGGFVLVDRITNDTVGAGMIRSDLHRSHNVSWQRLTIDKAARAASLHQTPAVLWLTGVSASGKSTIANLVEGELHRRGYHTYLLDGDNVRHGLTSDLGFGKADRVENIRRVAEVAKLMVDAGLIVLVSFISPFRSERQMARSLFGPAEFFEVFVDTPLAVAERRDPKGLYHRARRGELTNFTGIDSPYEPPENADIHIETTKVSARQAAREIIARLEAAGLII